MTVAARSHIPLVPAHATHLLEAIADDLARVDRELWETIPEGLGVVSKASRLILRSGGKRLRPALVLLSCRAFSGGASRAVTLASALEMIHGASLLHDDVVDDTHMRRGRSTVGALFNNKVAVMMGDYLFTRSLLELSRDETLPLMRIVSEATGRMVLGQLREIEETNNFDVTLDDYLFIIREKTAALIDACCRLGAIMGRADGRAIECMGTYGLNLGMAFQIVDDCLDFWGDEDVIGKPVGSDLGERKFTLPFIHAMQQVPSSQREEVRALLATSQTRLARRAFRKILSIMDEVDARRYAMSLAMSYGEQARRALREAAPTHAAGELEGLIDYVLERQG